MEANKKRFGLTGNQLKIFALIVMTIDHIGHFLLPEFIILRIIGRLAMPVFAWMIAEGCTYTKNPSRYFLTVFGFGLVCGVSVVQIAGNPDCNSAQDQGYVVALAVYAEAKFFVAHK